MTEHKFVTPTGPVVLHDSETGENFIPVAAMLASVRAHHPDITEPELIDRMAQVGWRWERQTARNPDNGDTITMDMFRSPAGWWWEVDE
jgi:hypothetical protein